MSGSLEIQDAKNRHLRTIAQLCRAISSQLRHISTIAKKNLLNSNISPTRPYNTVNFGPLTAEICWRVWGTPANFSGFRVLAALLHDTLVMALNRGRHLYSAGRPSRWALAHILVFVFFQAPGMAHCVQARRMSSSFVSPVKTAERSSKALPPGTPSFWFIRTA